MRHIIYLLIWINIEWEIAPKNIRLKRCLRANALESITQSRTFTHTRTAQIERKSPNTIIAMVGEEKNMEI